MTAPTPYDTALQMFVQAPREADMRRLQFFRWLAEQNKLEHAIAGPSVGRYSVSGDAKDAADLPAAA